MVDYLYTPVRPQDLTADMNDEAPGIWWHATCYSPYVIALERYDLVRKTPKGYWVKLHNYDDPPVWRTPGSRWMASTKAKALRQLLYRKTAHVKHAKRRLETAQRMLSEVRRAIDAQNTVE